MTYDEFKCGLGEIFADLEKEIDIRISVDKEAVDNANSKIKRVGNYKSKLMPYDKYPTSISLWSLKSAYMELGAKNLSDLMENKDRILRDRVFGYVLSDNFPEDVSSVRSLLNKERYKYGWPGFPLVGAAIGIFFKWWLAAGLGALGLAIGIAIAIVNTKGERYKQISKKLATLRGARKYVECELAAMSDEDRQRIKHLQANFNKKKLTREFERRRIAVISAQIDALSKPGSSSKQSASQSAEANDSQGSARREIVDEYGRTQGYVEDGRIYDNKSNLGGYVDSDSRVYDKSGARVGEVGSDGKITKYK